MTDQHQQHLNLRYWVTLAVWLGYNLTVFLVTYLTTVGLFRQTGKAAAWWGLLGFAAGAFWAGWRRYAGGGEGGARP